MNINIISLLFFDFCKKKKKKKKTKKNLLQITNKNCNDF